MHRAQVSSSATCFSMLLCYMQIGSAVNCVINKDHSKHYSSQLGQLNRVPIPTIAVDIARFIITFHLTTTCRVHNAPYLKQDTCRVFHQEHREPVVMAPVLLPSSHTLAAHRQCMHKIPTCNSRALRARQPQSRRSLLTVQATTLTEESAKAWDWLCVGCTGL